MNRKAKANRKKYMNTTAYDLASKEEERLDLRSLTLRQMETFEYLNGSNMPSSFRFREKEKDRI